MCISQQIRVYLNVNIMTKGKQLTSPYKTDRNDITEIFLKVALNTINQTYKQLNNK